MCAVLTLHYAQSFELNFSDSCQCVTLAWSNIFGISKYICNLIMYTIVISQFWNSTLEGLCYDLFLIIVLSTGMTFSILLGSVPVWTSSLSLEMMYISLLACTWTFKDSKRGTRQLFVCQNVWISPFVRWQRNPFENVSVWWGYRVYTGCTSLDADTDDCGGKIYYVAGDQDNSSKWL